MKIVARDKKLFMLLFVEFLVLYYIFELDTLQGNGKDIFVSVSVALIRNL